MVYANSEDQRAHDRKRVATRTLEQRLRRRAGDRARYHARRRLSLQGDAKAGDYLRLYAEEYARAERELGL